VSSDFLYEVVKIDSRQKILNESLPYKMPSVATALGFNMFFIHYKKYKYQASNILQPLSLIRIIVHSPYELPSYMGQEFFHSYHQQTPVSIEPEIQMIEESLRSIPPHQRNCFLPHEKPLKYFKVYTKTNCEHECLSEMMFKSCRCVPFYIISELEIIAIYLTNFRNSRRKIPENLHDSRRDMLQGNGKEVPQEFFTLRMPLSM
jgi:hypothetical protein